MSHHIQGQLRTESTLLPEALDDFVNEISLDSLGFHRVQPKQAGHPDYHPATLIKLYIYGYLNRI